MAEGRALRRHGNRTGIIYRGRQVPTLDPETGDMRFGVHEFIQHFLSLFSHSPGKEDFVFRARFLGELCELGGEKVLKSL